MSQVAIKNRDFCARSRTVGFVIENRPSQPTHLRDLLLLAATAAIDDGMLPGSIDRAILADVDVVDVLAVAGRLLQGQVRALTVNLRAAEAREAAVGGLFQQAVAMTGCAASVGAVSSVVGATDDGEIAVAGVVARCLRAFDDTELLDAAIALVAAALGAIAGASGATVVDVVRWSVGDETTNRSVPSRRVAYCERRPVDRVQRGPAHRR